MGSARSLTILLVDDSVSDTRLLKEALKESSLPIQVNVASDGAEALDYLHTVELGLATPPDLIVLDLNLPKKDGREVLVEIKGSPYLKQIPVLVMTSSNADEDVAEVYSLNANCYITKPTDLHAYMGVVRAIENFWFLTATLPSSANQATGLPRLSPISRTEEPYHSLLRH
jgi:chemotaxis family two-component system response regulator Rcp1